VTCCTQVHSPKVKPTVKIRVLMKKEQSLTKRTYKSSGCLCFSSTFLLCILNFVSPLGRATYSTIHSGSVISLLVHLRACVVASENTIQREGTVIACLCAKASGLPRRYLHMLDPGYILRLLLFELCSAHGTACLLTSDNTRGCALMAD
jgi:hypothetical protein